MNVELSISPDYVADWGLTAAIRELYQNSLDKQTEDPANELLFAYDPQLMQLSIGNRKSTLDVSTLVLGKTTKAANENAIGQFGEGYKLALVVLLRLGKSVVIYNNPSVWTPTIKHSEVFNTVVLNINIVKYRFKALPTHDLMFTIGGVTAEDYEAIKASNLHLHEEQTALDSPMGRILLDEQYKGGIYVSGLFVTKLDKARYGYDFMPKHISIGRDRDLVNEWDIFWRTSQMWASQAESAPLIEAMLSEQAPDIQHIDSYVWKLPKETTRVISNNWCNEHGCRAFPVSSEKGAAQARHLYGDSVKIVFVSPQMMAILKETEHYKSFTAGSIAKQTPKQLLMKLIKHPDRLKPSVLKELKAMVELAGHWDWKCS